MTLHPEPKAMTVNAFCITWNNNYFNILPPFSLGPVLAKVNRVKTEAVIMVPHWSVRYWYSQIMQMTNHEPLYFWPLAKNTILPDPKLQLMAIRITILLLKFYKYLGGNYHISSIIIIQKYWLGYSKTMEKIEITHVLDF